MSEQDEDEKEFFTAHDPVVGLCWVATWGVLAAVAIYIIAHLYGDLR